MSDYLIDTHLHYLPEALLAAFRKNDSPPRVIHQEQIVNPNTPGGVDPAGMAIEVGSGHAYGVVPEMTSVDLLIQYMDRFDVDAAVLQGPTPGVDMLRPADAIAVAVACNDELIDACRRHPNRFISALAMLPMESPDAAAEELQRVVALGMCGAQVFSNVNGAELRDERFQVVFDTASELDVAIRLHPIVRPGASAFRGYCLPVTIGYMADTSACALGLIFAGLFDRHPDFRLVIPHVGGVLPYLAGRIDYEAVRLKIRGGMGVLEVEPSEQMRLLYTDTISLNPGALRLAVEFFGTERVMFGSDHSFWAMRPNVEFFRTMDFPDGVREKVASLNAQRVFKLERAFRGEDRLATKTW